MLYTHIQFYLYVSLRVWGWGRKGRGVVLSMDGRRTLCNSWSPSLTVFPNTCTCSGMSVLPVIFRSITFNTTTKFNLWSLLILTHKKRKHKTKFQLNKITMGRVWPDPFKLAVYRDKTKISQDIIHKYFKYKEQVWQTILNEPTITRDWRICP